MDKKLLRLNWILLQEVWNHRNDKLHNTQTILDREGHKELLNAIENEWKIGLHQLPIREFAYLFQIKWAYLQGRTTSYLKLWFAKVRLGRELYQDDKLLTDDFSKKGPLRHWAGLENKRINERELNKSIKKEQCIGIGALPLNQYHNMFEKNDMHTDNYKITWFQTIRRAREDINDPNSIINVFSVEGPLRKWIGLSN